MACKQQLSDKWKSCPRCGRGCEVEAAQYSKKYIQQQELPKGGGMIENRIRGAGGDMEAEPTRKSRRARERRKRTEWMKEGRKEGRVEGVLRGGDRQRCGGEDRQSEQASKKASEAGFTAGHAAFPPHRTPSLPSSVRPSARPSALLWYECGGRVARRRRGSTTDAWTKEWKKKIRQGGWMKRRVTRLPRWISPRVLLLPAGQGRAREGHSLTWSIFSQRLISPLLPLPLPSLPSLRFPSLLFLSLLFPLSLDCSVAVLLVFPLLLWDITMVSSASGELLSHLSSLCLWMNLCVQLASSECPFHILLACLDFHDLLIPSSVNSVDFLLK